MKQPCKRCLIGSICKEACDKLLKYVRGNSRIYIPGVPSWLRCNCNTGHYFMRTHRFFVYVCQDCNEYRMMDMTVR